MLLVINAPPSTPILTQAPRLMTGRADIIESSERYGIAWRNWGTIKSQTIDDLVELLANDKAELSDTGKGLRLDVWSAIVVLRHFFGRNVFELCESHQIIFRDHVWIDRGFPEGFAETMRKNETALEAAHRAVEEEPGHSEPLLRDRSSYHLTGHRENILHWKSHDKWDGIEAVYHRTVIEGSIVNGRAFNPYGYVEIQKHKATFLKWKNVTGQQRRILGLRSD